MKRNLPAVLTLLLAVALASVAPKSGMAKKVSARTPYEPDQVIVKLRTTDVAMSPGARLMTVARLLNAQGAAADIERVSPIAPPILGGRLGEIIRDRGIDRLFVLKLDSGSDVEQAVKELRSRADVEYAEPNYRIELGSVPNDPLFYEQWALMNLGFSVGDFPSTPNADIKAYAAWDAAADDTAVVVAVTDTGVDQTHPDLVGNIFTNAGEIPDNGIDDDHNGYIDDVHGYNVADQNGDTSDIVGHGTSMSGLIGATRNNNVGIAGVARARILPVRFFKRTGPLPEDYDGSVADASRALLYSLTAGATIINASWRTLLNPDSVDPGESKALEDAVAATNDAGALLVCIAGNEGYDNDYSKVYPGAYELPNEIVVAASDFNDEIWHPPFNPYIIQSGFGKNSVHLAAPGVSVITILARGDCISCSQSSDPADWYGRADGTSLSAALVSGVAALLKSRYPDDNAIMLKRRILEGVQKIAGLDSLVITGGRLDAAGALAVSIEITPPELSSAKYKKGSEKLVLSGSNIERGVRVLISNKGYDAKATGDGTSLKLHVPISAFPAGVSVPIKLRNPDGGESQVLLYTR